MQIVLQNQDNREHDILDSDDSVSRRADGCCESKKWEIAGVTLAKFDAGARELQSLKSEITRVYRSRVVDTPK